jgi:hypothetical protein
MTEQTKCPACEAKRQHTDAEWKLYHPNAGQGHMEGEGRKA